MVGALLGVLVALLVAAVLLKVGVTLLRSMTTTLPPPPPAGEMRRVDLRYRCSLCGMETKVTLAADELPEPPRHCQEDMDLVAPAD
jgi:hypothetical protein